MLAARKIRTHQAQADTAQLVIPAQAGIQAIVAWRKPEPVLSGKSNFVRMPRAKPLLIHQRVWIAACAGMTA